MLTEEQFTNWIEALRSGNYKQGTGKLRDKNNCYCCLGVLADTIDPEGWAGNTWNDLGGSVPNIFIGMKRQYILTTMNDSLENSFEEIANYLEKNKEGFVE